MIGFWEILLIGVAIVLLFGATQIPKIARALGQGLKEFKKSVKEAKAIDNEKNDQHTDETGQEDKKDEKA